MKILEDKDKEQLKELIEKIFREKEKEPEKTFWR